MTYLEHRQKIAEELAEAYWDSDPNAEWALAKTDSKEVLKGVMLPLAELVLKHEAEAEEKAFNAARLVYSMETKEFVYRDYNHYTLKT